MRFCLRQPPWRPSALISTFMLCLLLLIISVSPTLSQPQNIEVFFPNTTSPPSPPPPPTLPFPPPPPQMSNKWVIGIAAGIIAAIILFLVVSICYLVVSYYKEENRVAPGDVALADLNRSVATPTAATTTTLNNDGDVVNVVNSVNEVGSAGYRFGKFQGNLKGLIVDENGLDVVYWRKLEGIESFKKEVFKKAESLSRKLSRRKNHPLQAIPLLRGESSSSHIPDSEEISKLEPLEIERQESNSTRSNKKTLPPPPGMSTLKPPPVQARSREDALTSGSSTTLKMKPLHWDKVNDNAEHSMVWDKINNGSFRFDGDMMEALFGYVANNNKSPQRHSKQANSVAAAAAASQVFILDSRKSQNIAIMLKSLTVSRQELIEGLTEGKGLSLETLEKLARIAPNKDEEQLILQYNNGDPEKLAFAESFLFQILRPVPTAFDRVSAMLFKLSYNSEVGNLKEMVKMVEMGCEELRRRGLLLKLLEAVLKAGNRMNAGTSRGNAQAVNLTALRKLSDVKSTDGKTTLLHFVVEQIVRSEGKRFATSKDDMEKDYMMLGLPVVGGLSSEFSNVKKAASIEYDQFSKACGVLESQVNEVQRIVSQCAARDGDGGFIREMRSFAESAEQELKFVKEEQKRVIELVRRTTEYYQTGASKDKESNHFQLFVIIKDFLGMVDQVCIEIAGNAQRKKTSGTTGNEAETVTKNAAGMRTVKFPNLPQHFMSMNDSSDDDSAEGGF